MSTREALIHDIENLPEASLAEVRSHLDSVMAKQKAATNGQTEIDTLNSKHQAVDEKGWPVGYFDTFAGIFANEPFERPPQLPYEKREEW